MRSAVVLKPYSKCSAEVNGVLFMSKRCVPFGVSQIDFFKYCYYYYHYLVTLRRVVEVLGEQRRLLNESTAGQMMKIK